MATKTSTQNTTQETETVSVPKQAPDPLDVLAAEESHGEVNVSTRTREIDDRIKRFVERGHTLWQEKPRGKWAINLGSAEEVKRVARDAKAYARELGHTFRVFNVAGPVKINGKDVPAEHALVYRVTSKTVEEATEPEKPETESE